MYEATFAYDAGTDKVASYQILSFHYGWKLSDENEIINGLFPQIVAKKTLSMKVINTPLNASGIESLRDAHFNKIPFEMTIVPVGFSISKPAYLSASLQLSGVRITNWYPIREVSTAFEGTAYAGMRGFLFSMDATEAKTTSSYKPNPFFLMQVLAGQG